MLPTNPGIKLNDVFVPGSFPKYTFVDRKAQHMSLAERISDVLDADGIMVALIGPSKSGKTQLLKKALGERKYIRISCSEIQSREDFLRELIDCVDFSAEETTTVEAQSGKTDQGNAKAGVNLEAVKFEVGFSRGASEGRKETTSRKKTSIPLYKIAEASKRQKLTIFFDNFHYIPPRALKSICQTLRSLIEDGFRCCIAYVPQRRDIILQGNPDLNNKVIKIEVGSWTNGELQEIARLGFNALNFEINKSVCEQLASESCFSPQIMQQLCFDFCRIHKVTEANKERTPFYPDMTLLPSALSHTSDSVHYAEVIGRMLEGKLERRGSKVKFHIFDNYTADFYLVAAISIALNDPKTRYSRVEIQTRLRTIFSNGNGETRKRPGIGKIENALKYFSEIDANWSLDNLIARLGHSDDKIRNDAFKDLFSDQIANSLIEYNTTSREVSILDPSFLFQLRNTPIIRRVIEKFM